MGILIVWSILIALSTCCASHGCASAGEEGRHSFYKHSAIKPHKNLKLKTGWLVVMTGL